MSNEKQAIDEEQIASGIVFDIEHYRQGEPFDRVAIGIHEWENRITKYIYDLDKESAETVLRIHAKYYLNREIAEKRRNLEKYHVEDGCVHHAGTEHELEQFIEDNFYVDPVISITDEFESVVDELN